jgi:aconitate hydratase
MFRKKYAAVFTGDQEWQNLPVSKGVTYDWNPASTYIKKPPYFENFGAAADLTNINQARILAIFGDSITTDHISPAGSIAKNSSAAKYLLSHGVEAPDFNSYGARRGNHEIMMRGTFANIRIKNEINPELEGGYTKYCGTGESISIFDASELYRAEGVPTVIFAGKEYGTGSSRDWAAKGPSLQGVRVVIAESFERIHRSNLVGMGIIPAAFMDGMTRADLQLTGTETITIEGLNNLLPRAILPCTIIYADGKKKTIQVRAKVDTEIELDYIVSGGILHYVLKNL